MQRSRFVHVCRGIFVLVLVLATASAAWAQSITDARRVEFTPSTDHNAVDTATGVALVQNYSLQLFLAGGAAPLQTVTLGKPAPQGDGMIRVDFVALLPTALTPGLIYEVVITAVGPGGSSASGRSNTFGFSLPCAPSISPTSQSIAAGGGTGKQHGQRRHWLSVDGGEQFGMDHGQHRCFQRRSGDGHLHGCGQWRDHEPVREP